MKSLMTELRNAEAPVAGEGKLPGAREVSVAVVGILLVVTVGLSLRSSAFDLGVTRAFAVHDTGIIGALATGFYGLFEPVGALVTIAAVAVLLAWRASAVLGLRFGATMAVTWAPVWLVKVLVSRPRPQLGGIGYAATHVMRDTSYPSGHTAFASVLAVTLVLSLAHLTRRTRVISWIAAPLIIVVMVTTVLTLGVHFPSDAAASVVWAVTVTPAVWTLSGWAVYRVRETPIGAIEHVRLHSGHGIGH